MEYEHHLDMITRYLYMQIDVTAKEKQEGVSSKNMSYWDWQARRLCRVLAMYDEWLCSLSVCS